MHRRGFIAISAASAAASSVSGMPALSRLAGEQRLAKPELMEIHPIEQDMTRAVAARPFPLTIASESVTQPTIELNPLACTETRIADNAGIDIELRHPGCGIDSILYSAHNTGLGAFPAGIASPIHTDSSGTATLIVTQRLSEHRQQHQIRINARRAGPYLLAIPTEPGARAPVWRASTIELNESRTPIHVRSLFESRARTCMLMSVRILETNDLNQGAHHAG
jgi:hypothetical protein